MGMNTCPFQGQIATFCSYSPPQDYIDTEMLLCAENVNQDNLLSYAREAADFATNYQLPSLDYAMNHYGQPDVAMFDFTSMYASENAALVRERQSHQLLVALVGDSLLEVAPPIPPDPCIYGVASSLCCRSARGQMGALPVCRTLPSPCWSPVCTCPLTKYREAHSIFLSYLWALRADLFVKVQNRSAPLWTLQAGLLRTCTPSAGP